MFFLFFKLYSGQKFEIKTSIQKCGGSLWGLGVFGFVERGSGWTAETQADIITWKKKILSHNNKHVLQSDPLWFCLSGKTISCLLRDSPQLQHLIYGYRRPRLYRTGQALLSTWDMKPLSSDVLRHVTTLSSWMIHRQENGNVSRSQQRGMLQSGFFLPFYLF